MIYFLVWLAASFAVGIVYSSFFEWFLHRYVMHRPVGPFRYPFEKHAVIHHQMFKADHTYHLVNEDDKETIPMAWWNGPFLVICCSAPFWVAGLIFSNWGLVVGGFLSGLAYYATYEYLHWCMHLPKERQIEKPWFFRKVNGHHLLHHRYMHKNFNVVLPLADLCLGTLVARSPICFAQARGPAVPNVQPRQPSTPIAIAPRDDKRTAVYESGRALEAASVPITVKKAS
jgi:hypothetical protein